MPSQSRSEVDWATGKREWCAGQLSREAIATMIGCKRQSLSERAEKEGWIYGSDVTSEGAMTTTDTPESEPGPIPEIDQCLALIMERSETVQRQEQASIDQRRQWVVGPDNLARALHAAHQGAKGIMLADAAGLDDQTLRRTLQNDEALRGMIRAAHATHALRSLQALEKAQERGDAGSAKFLLEKGPYAAEYGGSNGPGGVVVNVLLNIGDPQPASNGAILEIGPDGVLLGANKSS